MSMGTLHPTDCGGTEAPLFTVSDRNRRIGSREFSYLRCAKCGLIRLGDAPEDLALYYPQEYYELPRIEELAAAASRDRCKIDTVQRFTRPGRLLEIGPAYGTFAYQARQAGFAVDAIEMDERCCGYLRSVVGVNAVCSAAPQEALQAMAPHDVIALWHVIEHLPDPFALLRATAANLAPGGILVIATPNPDAWQFGVMGADWPHVDAPRHLYLLPAGMLTEHASAAGLTRIHFTTSDSDARSWNRFGWQRLLLNRVRGKWASRAALAAGYAISLAAAPFEGSDPRGSAYTIVFRKERQE
ncbi:MAG TPA: class I SAM-dependent methyltransferase [Burkholderiales bacterium]|nr:class I SAM-dependent methyltransferase [Burkholderiales bacterium]